MDEFTAAVSRLAGNVGTRSDEELVLAVVIADFKKREPLPLPPAASTVSTGAPGTEPQAPSP